MISGANIRIEEKLARVGERPVFWDCVLGFWVLFGGLNEGFEGLVFADELKCRVWSDFRNRVEVIAAEKNA